MPKNHRIEFKLNLEEKRLLIELSKLAKFSTVSGFIRYRVFGCRPEEEQPEVLKLVRDLHKEICNNGKKFKVNGVKS